MVINSPCLTDKKELAILGKTATGKEFSNPLMAVNSVKQIRAIVDGKAVVITDLSVRNDLLFDDEDGITCLTNDEFFENLALIGWQSQAPRNQVGTPAQNRSERALKQPNEPPFLEGHTYRSGEGRMEHTFELMDIVPPTPHDSPLPGGYTLGSDEGRLKLEELMAMCTKLSKQVLDLEKEKDTQVVKSSDDDLDKEDESRQGRISDKTKLMFKNSDFDDLDDLVDEGMDFVQEKDAENQGKIGDDDTKVVKGSAKEKGVTIKDVEVSSRVIRSITTLQPLPTIYPKDKGKGILQETKPVEKTKKKVQGDAQIERDAKVALRLQA
ncbi:hypothetical protein Tco_0817416 [Tanacetum coccineum]